MNSSKTFRKWTEEERRAHQRAYNAAYTERLLFRMSEEEYRQRELEKAQRVAFKKKEDAGEWVSKGKKISAEKVTVSVTPKAMTTTTTKAMTTVKC